MQHLNQPRFVNSFFALVIGLFACAQSHAQSAAPPIRAEALYEQCSSLQGGAEAAVVENALAALKGKETAKRVRAAEALAKSCDSRAVEPLVAALKDTEVAVRIAAVEALGQLGDRNSIGPLIEALDDQDWRVRAALGRALCSFQVYQSSHVALNRLVNPGDQKIADEGDLRARCIGILMINQLRDVRYSRKAISFLFTFLDHENEKLRRIAEETALELKNTRNGFRELIGILKQHSYPDFRRKAAYYLGKYNIEEARPALAEAAVGARDASVQKAAKEALEAMKKQ
jgi:HEAT repeat protein